MKSTDAEISPKKLFKILFWGYLGIYVPMSLLMGVLTLVGFLPININGEPTTGFTAMLIVLVFIPFSVLILAGINWVMLTIGLWIYSTVRAFFS